MRIIVLATALALAGCAASYGGGRLHAVQTANERQVLIAYNTHRMALAEVQEIADRLCRRFNRAAVYEGEAPGGHYVSGWTSFDVGRLAVFRCVS